MGKPLLQHFNDTVRYVLILCNFQLCNASVVYYFVLEQVEKLSTNSMFLFLLILFDSLEEKAEWVHR